MISQKLKTILKIAFLISIVHGLEEYITGFYKIDKSYLISIGRLSTSGNAFLFYQLVLWLLFLMLLILIYKNKKVFGLIILVGILLTLEVQHLYEAIVRLEYYSGLWTSLLFIPTVFLFWKELLKQRRSLSDKLEP